MQLDVEVSPPANIINTIYYLQTYLCFDTFLIVNDQTDPLDLANVTKSNLNPNLDLATIGQTDRDAHESPGQIAQVG